VNLNPEETRVLNLFAGWLATHLRSEAEARGVADLIDRFERELPEDWRALAGDVSDVGGVAVEIEPRNRMAIFGEIHVERQRQDDQWGGADTDDARDLRDWWTYIEHQAERASLQCVPPGVGWRSRFVKIAALAVAAIESIDRRRRRPREAGL